MSEDFLHAVPEIERFSDVIEPHFYRDAPDHWHVVLTDVRGSTKAIEAGRYRDVNALGVASIVAIRNATPPPRRAPKVAPKNTRAAATS